MFSVLGKAAKERRRSSICSSATMMVDHDNHHYLPFPSCGFGGSDFGPTRSRSNRWMISSDIYDNVGGGGDGATVTSGGAGGLRSLQPFHISPSIEPAFKSPGGMATSLGFPFTNAQWKELERQAMIYKYMIASFPVPLHLLIPTPRNLFSDPPACSPLGSGLNLKFTKGADLEPGRCKRTDGKKWRCSRDVAPDQKYCERHMHRGRPRSRKPVELHANTNTDANDKKTTRYSDPAISAESPVPLAISSDPTDNHNGVASQFGGTISQPYLQALILLDKPSDEVANFDTALPFASRFKEPRNIEWMVKAEPGDQQWHQTKIGLSCAGSFNPEYQEHALNLNSFGNFRVGEDQQSYSQFSLFLNETPPPPPRDFIDAWSSDEQSAISRKTSSAVSSNGKLLRSALSLTMGGINSMDDEMGQIQMGLGLMESDQNRGCCARSLPLSPASWAGVAPGGPLAEVLHLSSVNTTAAANQSSSLVAENDDCGTSPPATALSSPSGVLQKIGTSFSDSSSNSSPALASTVRAKSETGLLWLNEGKLQSSG